MDVIRFDLGPFRALRLADSFVGESANRPYRGVPGKLRDWQRRRNLTLDKTPALYAHEYTSSGVTVRGVVGLLDLTTSRHAVLPHEGIYDPQVKQLAQRMQEASVNPAPILLMHRGPARAREGLTVATNGDPDFVYTDRAGQLQRVWRITDQALVTQMSDSLRSSRPVIADGHHRWAAAGRLHDAHPHSAWSQTLVMLIDQDDTPLQLSAIHRVVAGLKLSHIEERLGRMPSQVKEVEVVWEQHTSSHTALAGLSHSLVLHDGRTWATLTPKMRRPELLVSWLHEELLPSWGVGEDRIRYHHAAADALDRAGTGVAILTPAPTYDQVLGAASSHALLPRKVTSFQPKPHFGVLMRELPDE